jgi:hypothetical protein
MAIKVVGKAQGWGSYHSKGAKVAAEGGTLYFGVASSEGLIEHKTPLWMQTRENNRKEPNVL